MRKRGRPKKQKSGRNPNKRPGRPRKRRNSDDEDYQRPSPSKRVHLDSDDERKDKGPSMLVVDDGMSEGLHMTTSQVNALGSLVSCRECGENVRIGIRPTTKGMISEFTVSCTVCEDNKSTNTPNFIRERKRKREKPDAILQKTENINYAHVAAFLDNGLGYSGLRHYCKYFNARCLNEATFIVYARQVISDVVADTEESLLYSANIVREVFKSQLETDGLIDLTVSFTTTYHQWGSDFCLVAGAVIELKTGLVLDYDVANMYCHVCKINAKKIVSMSPTQMTEWFNKHQDTCEIREWCDELDHDADEGVKEIEPKYLECFIAKKIWSRSIEKYGFRYTTLIHESDEKVHEELSRACVYEDMPILIDSATSCFTRRKSENARTSFQTKLKAKCPRERVQTKDRIMYVYAMSIPEYNKFAISSNIKLRQLVKGLDDATLNETTIIIGGDAGTVEEVKIQGVKHGRIVHNEENGDEDEEDEMVDEPDEQELGMEKEQHQKQKGRNQKRKTEENKKSCEKMDEEQDLDDEELALEEDEEQQDAEEYEEQQELEDEEQQDLEEEEDQQDMEDEDQPDLEDEDQQDMEDDELQDVEEEEDQQDLEDEDEEEMDQEWLPSKDQGSVKHTTKELWKQKLKDGKSNVKSDLQSDKVHIQKQMADKEDIQKTIKVYKKIIESTEKHESIKDELVLDVNPSKQDIITQKKINEKQSTANICKEEADQQSVLKDRKINEKMVEKKQLECISSDKNNIPKASASILEKEAVEINKADRNTKYESESQSSNKVPSNQTDGK